ncbi:MAG: ATP-binding protein [Oscillospiraceae bacterium]|nr:ATP-binding protein [Oscillospiraceae bacterium]
MSKVTIPARLERLHDVFEFVDGFMKNAQISAELQGKIKLAVEEIFVNIASYAYPNGHDNDDVTVRLSVDSGRLTVEFRDSGTPYNPLTKPDPDTSLSVAERGIGGFGVYFVKSIMDSVEYRYENGRNILITAKDLVQ